MVKDHLRIVCLTFLFSATGSLGFAQFNLGFKESLLLPFNQNGALRLATAGGFNNPQFSEIDLNGDGTMDLFVFDRSMDTWRTFIYNSSISDYEYAPIYEVSFPAELNELALLRDYNCDGHNDILTYVNGGIRVFRNNGDSPPTFELVASKLQSDYGSVTTSLYLLPGDVPAIIDVDNDGDLDILAFGNGDSENSIVWHRNQSMEEYGICDSLKFVVETECWGGIEEPPNSSELVGSDCESFVQAPISQQNVNRFHPGSTVTLIDTDGDSDKDLLIGDIQTKRLVFAVNIGSPNLAEIDTAQQSTVVPNAQDPAIMQYMLAAYEMDANHDGKQDLVISPNNNIDSSCNAEQVWLYHNTATVGTNYQLATQGFLSEEMIDLGTGTVPIYFDVDGDGLEDLLVASDFYRSPSSSQSSRIHYFRNNGTSTVPSFVHDNDNFANLAAFNLNAASPALGDLDGDGDQDMIIGVADGSLHYFRNDPSGAQANFTLTEPNYKGINSISQNAAPEIADLNGDGLLDLIVGERSGKLLYFQNTGTAGAANYPTEPSISDLGGIDVSFFCCLGNAAPRIIKNTAFGSSTYLFVGTSEKRINVYEVSTDLSSTFPLVDSIFILADRITPAINDINHDGVFDLLCGTGEGGIKFYDRVANYPVGVFNKAAKALQDDPVVFPNPAKDVVRLSFHQPFSGSIEIHSLEGQVLTELTVSQVNDVSIPLHQIANGTYFILCTTGSTFVSKKIVVLK